MLGASFSATSTADFLGFVFLERIEAVIEPHVGLREPVLGGRQADHVPVVVLQRQAVQLHLVARVRDQLIDLALGVRGKDRVNVRVRPVKRTHVSLLTGERPNLNAARRTYHGSPFHGIPLQGQNKAKEMNHRSLPMPRLGYLRFRSFRRL